MKIYRISIFSIFITLLSCHPGKTSVKGEKEIKQDSILFTVGAQAIVYKTVKDYSHNVPVIMDDKRMRIISYPAISDVYYRGNLSYPTPLKNGYLLDNRGIGANVAFLSYSYEEYSKLETIPPIKELEKQIINRYPLLELWNCGLRSQYKEEVTELNALIDIGFNGCKKINIILSPLTNDTYVP